MNAPDAWSLITGMASVLSLLVALPERYANWRRQLVPFSAALGGFAIGRLSFVVGSADQLLSDPAGARSLILMLSLIVTVALVAYALIRRGQTILGYGLVTFLILPVQLLTLYQRPTDVVSVDDYILLATGKAQARQFDTSLKYFAAAKRSTENEGMRRSIDKQIELVVAEAAKPKTP
jgi:hypothetical protein